MPEGPERGAAAVFSASVVGGADRDVQARSVRALEPAMRKRCWEREIEAPPGVQAMVPKRTSGSAEAGQKGAKGRRALGIRGGVEGAQRNPRRWRFRPGVGPAG